MVNWSSPITSLVCVISRLDMSVQGRAPSANSGPGTKIFLGPLMHTSICNQNWFCVVQSNWRRNMCDDWLRLQPGMLHSLLKGGADRAILLARRLSMASKFTFIANSDSTAKFPSVIHNWVQRFFTVGYLTAFCNWNRSHVAEASFVLCFSGRWLTHAR